MPAEERVAASIAARKFFANGDSNCMAWLTFEIGKTWPEADADIAELIDFCEYYGREALRLAGPQKLHPIRGEKNYLKYIPLGVGIVIPPWNFAAAIMGGMTVAVDRDRQHGDREAFERFAHDRRNFRGHLV